MLPNNSVIPEPIESSFLYPDDVDSSDLVSYEMGGAALNDGSGGLKIKVWKASIDGSSILVGPVNETAEIMFSVSGELSAVALAFDANMQPAIAYIEGGIAKLYWYDAESTSFVHTPFVGAQSPKLSTDDKRAPHVGTSDIIFGYVRSDLVCWRQQRDRYAVEYVAGPANGLKLARMGMGRGNRFQFELRR